MIWKIFGVVGLLLVTVGVLTKTRKREDVLYLLGGLCLTAYSVSITGLVHISGVEADIPKDAYRDEHRVLAGPGDTMKSKEQIVRLDELGYTGDFSFEPFSPVIQKLGKAELAAALGASLDYLLAR